MSQEGMTTAVARMRDRGLGDEAVAVFEHYYRQLEGGARGTIPEDTIEPLGDLRALDAMEITKEQAREALAQTAIVKLNGGLGTSMGLAGPKSCLVVKDGLTFLDIIVRQVLATRERYDVELPLILMNSFRTSAESMAVLQAYPDLQVGDLPLEFLQNAEPKLREDDLRPVDWERDPDLEWCPPGHGDVYVALMTSGLADRLIERGIRYVFLSNADNLGATCDPEVAAWMIREDLPYVAEVCQRTPSDRKGGHLARRKDDGQLILRDTAMVEPGEEHYFGDIERHTTFHVNNLWVDLEVMREQMRARQGVLGLPIIVNRKTVDPEDSDSTPVIQMESAMGTAIEVFEGSEALTVPRSRFRPVKTTNDLLVIQSDFFSLDEDYRLVPVREGDEPFVDLDKPYKFVSGYAQRFLSGAPSMQQCTSLRVSGGPTFGADVVCVGDVVVEGVEHVPDGAVLRGDAREQGTA